MMGSTAEAMMDSLARLRGWGGPADSFEVVQAASRGPDGWMAKLRATAATEVKGETFYLQKPAGDVRVWVLHNVPVSPEGLERARASTEAREELRRLVADVEAGAPGPVTCTLSIDRPSPAIELRAFVYEDGFTRHAVNGTLLDLGKARRLLHQCIKEWVQAARVEVGARGWIKEREDHLAGVVAKLTAASPAVAVAVPAGPAGPPSRTADETSRTDPVSTPDGPAAGARTRVVSPPSPRPVPSMICPRCDRPLREDFKLCPSCGAPIRRQA